eukprot:1122142-Rhodomonas_salina.2
MESGRNGRLANEHEDRRVRTSTSAMFPAAAIWPRKSLSWNLHTLSLIGFSTYRTLFKLDPCAIWDACSPGAVREPADDTPKLLGTRLSRFLSAPHSMVGERMDRKQPCSCKTVPRLLRALPFKAGS